MLWYSIGGLDVFTKFSAAEMFLPWTDLLLFLLRKLARVSCCRPCAKRFAEINFSFYSLRSKIYWLLLTLATGLYWKPAKIRSPQLMLIVSVFKMYQMQTADCNCGSGSLFITQHCLLSHFRDQEMFSLLIILNSR